MFSPLGFAVHNDQSLIVEALLAAGADANAEFEVGGVKFTPVRYAEEKNKKRSLKTLQTFKPKTPAAAAPTTSTPANPPATVAVTSTSATLPPPPAAAVAASISIPAPNLNVAPAAADRTLLLFPGQGAQKVGMGKGLEAFPGVPEMIAKAKEILGFDLWDVCLNGPEERLNSTLVSQPALFLVSLAALQKLQREEPARVASCVATCGLSLGEYTALVFAGVISFEEGLRLVKARAEAMQAAADANRSGMVSVLGIADEAKVRELCEVAAKNTGSRCFVSNLLCAGNTAVSGAIPACDEVVRLGPQYGAIKVVKLNVAGAFHSDFMQMAYDKLAAVLEGIDFQKPRFPVILNVDAQEEVDPKRIKAKLLEQLVKPVLWEKSILAALQKFELAHAVEVGPGNALTGIMRRILKDYKGDKKPTPKAMGV